MVHMVPGAFTGALDFAMHAGAWQTDDGAQSASDWQASELLIGSHGAQPHPRSGEGGVVPDAAEDGSGSGSAEAGGLVLTTGGFSLEAGGAAGCTSMVAAGCVAGAPGAEEHAYSAMAASAVTAAMRRRVMTGL